MPKKKIQKGAAEMKQAGRVARSLGARLRDLRTQRAMSQGDIEQRTGLLRCYVSRVEGGYTVPSIDTLEKFAAALAVPLHALFQQGKAPDPAPARQARAAKPAPADSFTEKVRRLAARMDDRDRDTFLSLLRKLVVQGT
jgi:transcriptional regulator with XRE-family HTH domain